MLNEIEKYQSLVNETIPVSRYMAWKIESLEQNAISTTTELAPNINVHGTGFAGSVYSAAMATGWTLLRAWYARNNYQTVLLAAEANIKYLSPVNCDFISRSTIDIDSEHYQKLTERLQQKKSCGFPLTIEVVCKNKVCAILEVQFVFKC